jgi:hypothetical protein
VARAASVDVVKIDTDGYDGCVLLGARGTLAQYAPVVQFEWHPALARAAGVDVVLPFTTLRAAGYESFVWFDKFGAFSRLEHGVDIDAIVDRADWCIDGDTPAPDWHYDVIALAPADREVATGLAVDHR